jgi:uncharacterized protein YjiS (DUF1127 family)
MSARTNDNRTGTALRRRSTSHTLTALRFALGLAASAMHRLLDAIETARAERAMMDLPDHLLKDIGVSRGQVPFATKYGRLDLDLFE